MKWFVMDCMGERVSANGTIAMVCHGEIKGLIFFFMCVIGGNSSSWMAELKRFFIVGLGERDCHGWNWEMVCHRWLG